MCLFVYGIKIVFHVPIDRHMERVECECVRCCFSGSRCAVCRNVRPAIRTSVLAVRDDPEGLRVCDNKRNLLFSMVT